MRVFIPAVHAELTAPTPPVRNGWTAVPPAGATHDDIEVLEDDAQTEAALASLTLLRDSAGAPATRLILAVDSAGACQVGDAVDGVAEAEVPVYGWGDVKAILLDGEDAAPAVQRVISADDQDDADEAVADLWDYALEWYDIEELPDVIDMLSARGASQPA